jgi:hypothetical protein
MREKPGLDFSYAGGSLCLNDINKVAICNGHAYSDVCKFYLVSGTYCISTVHVGLKNAFREAIVAAHQDISSNGNGVVGLDMHDLESNKQVPILSL